MTCECWKNFGENGRHNTEECKCECQHIDRPFGKCKFCDGNVLVAQIPYNQYAKQYYFINNDLRLEYVPKFCVTCGKMNVKNSFINENKKSGKKSCQREDVYITEAWTKKDMEIVEKYNKMDCLD